MNRSKHEQVAWLVFKWWRKLHSDAVDRGTRARLRRVRDVRDILSEPVARELFMQVCELMDGQRGLERWARKKLELLVPLLAQIGKTDPNCTFAEVLGRTRAEENKPCVSETRFNVLLRSSGDPKRFMDCLCRLVRQLSGVSFCVKRLILDVLFWDNNQTPDEWSYSYWGVRTGIVDAQSNSEEEVE